MANKISLNPTSYHGAGAINEIATEIKAHGFKKAFVASDPDLVKFGVTGKVTDFSITEAKPAKEENAPGTGKGAAVENVEIKFGYCTEFIIML